MSPDQMFVLKSLVERDICGYFVYADLRLRRQMDAEGLNIISFASALGLSGDNLRLAYDYRPIDDPPYRSPFHGASTMNFAAVAFHSTIAAMMKFHGFDVVAIEPQAANLVFGRWSDGIQKLLTTIIR